MPNVESSSNARKSFTQTWRGSRQDYSSTSGPVFVDSISTTTVPERYATRLNNKFRNGTGVRIATQTVRSRLHEFGLSARRPAVRVPLTRQHVQDRLDFARTHVRWTIRAWTPVLFTDESRFCLDFADKRQLVWRMSKERFHYLNVAEQ